MELLSDFNIKNLYLDMRYNTKYVLPQNLVKLFLSRCDKNNFLAELLNNLPTNLNYLKMYTYCNKYVKHRIYPELDYL